MFIKERKQEKPKNIGVTIEIIALISLVIVAGLMRASSMTQVTYAFLVVIGVVFAFLPNPKYSFCYLFFMLPFAYVFKLSPASTSLFTYLMLLNSIVLLRYAKEMNGLALGSIAIFAMYLTPGASGDIAMYMKFVCGFILLYEFVENYKVEDYQWYILSFALGMLTSSILGIYRLELNSYKAFFPPFDTLITGGKIVYRYAGLYEDPNYYSVSMIIAIQGLMMHTLCSKTHRLFNIALTICLVVAGSLSYSKAYIIALALILCVDGLSLLRTEKHGMLVRILFVSLFLVLVVAFGSSNLMGTIKERFDTKDISNGRMRIWISYGSYFANSLKTLLFGDGIGTGFYLGDATHNTYIDLVYYFGILGSILYISTIIIVCRSKVIHCQRKLINYIGLFAFLVLIGTLAILRTGDLIFYIMLIWIMINYSVSAQKLNSDSITSQVICRYIKNN